MGIINIQTSGSFGGSSQSFSAMKNGHADAVAQAIEYLSSKVLPEAIALDHKLHTRGQEPLEGFKRK